MVIQTSSSRLNSKQIKRVKELAKEGLEYGDISKTLAAEGIVGPRNGKPLATSTISQILRRSGKRRNVTAKSLGEKAARSGGKSGGKTLAAIRTLLDLDIDDGEKLALISLVVGDEK